MHMYIHSSTWGTGGPVGAIQTALAGQMNTAFPIAALHLWLNTASPRAIWAGKRAHVHVETCTIMSFVSYANNRFLLCVHVHVRIHGTTCA